MNVTGRRKTIVSLLFLAALLTVLILNKSTLLEAKTEKPLKKDYSIRVNGAVLKDGDTSVYEFSDTIFIPLRQTAETMGFQIIWEPKTQSVRMDNGKIKSRIYLARLSARWR